MMFMILQHLLQLQVYAPAFAHSCYHAPLAATSETATAAYDHHLAPIPILVALESYTITSNATATAFTIITILS